MAEDVEGEEGRRRKDEAEIGTQVEAEEETQESAAETERRR